MKLKAMRAATPGSKRLEGTQHVKTGERCTEQGGKNKKQKAVYCKA